MSYYLLRKPDGSRPQMWRIDDASAQRLGVTNAQSGAGSYFKAEEGKTIWDTVRDQTPWFGRNGENPFYQTILQPAQYYPRIARPNDQHPDAPLGWCPGNNFEQNAIAIARGQLTTLVRQLGRICQTVHPTVNTFGTFGHDIRNLLILACTEVEAHWRGVLAANGIMGKKLSTNDYVKLRDAMKLDEYAIGFTEFPWLAAIKPFEGWGRTAGPTQDLAWYAAYNAVKHNREGDFELATLGAAFAAVTGCFIMILAQYGHTNYSLGSRAEAASFFALNAGPCWSPADVYIHPYGEPSPVTWSPVPFPF